MAVCVLVCAFSCMPPVLLKALAQQRARAGSTGEVTLDELYADAKPDFIVQTM